MPGAGVVDQQVDTAQVGEDGADARVDRLIAGDVEGPELHSGQFVGDPRNDSAVSGWRAVAMTFQAAAASARVVASPMPLLAPVTTATDGISLRSP